MAALFEALRQEEVIVGQGEVDGGAAGLWWGEGGGGWGWMVDTAAFELKRGVQRAVEDGGASSS